MTFDSGMGQPSNVAVSFPPMGMMGGYGMGCGGFGYGNDWLAVIILAALFGGGFGGGFGGFGGGGGALGLGAIYGSQQFNQLDNGIRSIQNGLCDGFYSVATSNLQAQNQTQRDLCQGFSSTAAAITENRFAAQQCCCETQRLIESVKYANSENTCNIINAIHAEGEATRGLMTQNTIQALRDKLNDKDRDIQTRDFQLSQLSQNAYLVNTLQPAPKPAFIVNAPCQPVNNTCGCNGYYAA